MTTEAKPSTIADPGAMSRACYQCRHRRDLPGDMHSGCRHPLTEAVHGNPLAPLIEAMGHALPVPVPGLNVIGDKHAIGMGYWSWPINFDPVWLISCDGFEEMK
jgi:hypothetical protein